MNRQPQLIPMGIGERLKFARMERGLALSDVSSRLRIDEPVVSAIEADKLEHLAPLYRRGYISVYARFLEFDPAEIAQMLESLDDQHPELLTVFPQVRNTNPADRWLKATSYILASLVIGTLAWQFTHEAVRLSQKSAAPMLGSQGPAQDAVSPGQGINPASRNATHVNASIASLENHEKQAGARNSAGRGAWAALRNDPGAEPGATPAVSTLELSASGDSWVEISDAQGNQLELDLIRGGTSKQYTGTAPFNVQFGRASAVSLYLDGQAVDLAPYTEGDVTQMVLSVPRPGLARTQDSGGN